MFFVYENTYINVDKNTELIGKNKEAFKFNLTPLRRGSLAHVRTVLKYPNRV